VLAGFSFGVGVWFKYPTVLAVPAALALTGRRRWIPFLAAFALTVLILFAPFLGNLHLLYEDTVVYQQSRFVYPLTTRMLSILLFGVLLQPLAIFGLTRRPVQWWLVLGYAGALVYLGSSQVYYHYLLPVTPFAAILGAMYLGGLSLDRLKLLMASAIGAVMVTIIWGFAVVDTPGNYPFHVTAAHVASVTPVQQRIDTLVGPNGQILDDQPDLPVLAYRRNCDDYFWSDNTVVSHSQLQHCLLEVRYVVHFFSGGSGFPPGFLLRAYDGSATPPLAIDDKYKRMRVGSSAFGAYIYDTHHASPYLPPRG
jgi:hypothetical protein